MQADDINSIESEVGVIASLIHNPDLYFYSENLLPEHFTNKENGIVYRAICNLAKRGITKVDAYNIMESLASDDETKKYVDTITVDRLQELVEYSDTLARGSAEEYKLLSDNILEAAFRRDMFKILKECELICCSNDIEDRRQKIYDNIDNVMTSYSTVEDIPTYDEVVDGLWDEIRERQGDGYAGIPFKFEKLNEYVTIEKGELIIFGAQQKVGKSIMLLNIAVDLLRQGYSVLYIDSELSSRMFTGRLLAHLSGVSHMGVKSGSYTQEEEENIKGAIEWIKTRNFTHIYMPFFSQQAIYTAVKKTNHKYPIDVLIIDYFKSTGNEVDAFQTYAAMGKCVDLVKNEIAGAMNIAAIGAAQATVNNRLADSAKIARNASTIIMLIDKTPEEIEADGVECGNKKLVVANNRNGMQHVSGEYIDMVFDGNHISYEQAPKQHIPRAPY